MFKEIIAKSINEEYFEKGRGPDKVKRKTPIREKHELYFESIKSLEKEAAKHPQRIMGAKGWKWNPTWMKIQSEIGKLKTKNWNYVVKTYNKSFNKSQVHVGPYQRAGHYVQGYSASRPEGEAQIPGVNDLGINPEAVDKVKKEIKAPYVNAQYSTLGGVERASLLVTVSLDDKKDWINGYLENSRYARFHLNKDGSLHNFSGYGLSKFRKTKFKTLDEAVSKINKFIETNKQAQIQKSIVSSLGSVNQAYEILKGRGPDKQDRKKRKKKLNWDMDNKTWVEWKTHPEKFVRTVTQSGRNK